MRVLFLDRNVISTIKDHILGKTIDRKRLSRLRDLDKPNTIISAIFSVREGQSARLESREKMLATLNKDYEAIRGFFKNAHSDLKYINKDIDGFLDAFCGAQEQAWRNYEILIKYVKRELYQPIKKTERKLHKDKILSLAKENNIPYGHPVLMCCLALLYGSNDAVNIIKPKKVCLQETEDIDAYNSLSDLMVLSRISTVSAVYRGALGGNVVLEYVTFDKGLDGFLSKVNLISSVCVNGTTTASKTEYRMELFPFLNESEYLDLHREMGADM